MDHVIHEKPEAVVATGARHVNGVAELAFITVYCPNDVVAHVNLSWLSPVKVRQILIGGNRRMLVYDDTEPSEKVRVYDAGIKVSTTEGIYATLVDYRTGERYVWGLAAAPGGGAKSLSRFL